MCWFQDAYVDSITQLRKTHYATLKHYDLAEYYMGLDLPNTVALMRRTPFPASVPVIDLVSEKNFPIPAWAARWKDCHRQFAMAEPDREGITAYGCGHFIFRDNPPLAINAIVKAYTGAVDRQQGYEIMKRFLSYSFEEVNKR